ncbi:hypothetical protein A2U01_0090059, partial [Trifolium medium]|nr:hypothetical protein [Trifolium medium]
QLTGATRRPLLRGAQMTEALNFPFYLLARRAILACATRNWQKLFQPSSASWRNAPSAPVRRADGRNPASILQN